MTETHRVRDLAEMIAAMTGAKIAWLPNPRKEAAENELVVREREVPRARPRPDHAGKTGLLAEIVDVGRKFAYRVDRTPRSGRLRLDQGHRRARSITIRKASG